LAKTGPNGRIEELQKQATELAADIQSLSHELHSSRLQYLGITAAMPGFYKEFSDQQNVETNFKAHDLPAPLSPDISPCFFRVLQEALHNAAKASPGLALISMKERLKILNGTFSIESQPQHGTTIHARVPFS
jgi:signal transduction histidine kinase